MNAFESRSNPAYQYPSPSLISLERTWKNNRCEWTENPQLRGFKQRLREYFSSSWHAFQHYKADVLYGCSNAAMWFCHRCTDSWLLRNHYHTLDQADPMPSVWLTEIVVWRWDLVVIAIDRLSAIYPQDDCRHSGRWDGETGSKTISGRLSG